ncbi:MAG: hypothetical protein ACTTG8_00035 [Catonella sp.]|uniref:hypothetical protein n=1 Tax=Catonella sp. TaxID=2382125 RepID=UPI003F9F9ABF
MNKLNKIKFMAIVIFAFMFALSNLEEVAEAENAVKIAEKTDSEKADSEVEENIDNEDTEDTDENREENIEEDDEFDDGGLNFVVTDIDEGKAYAELTGVVNEKTTLIYIPKKVEYKDTEIIVNSISDSAFAELKGLRKVILDAEIEDVDKDMFKGVSRIDRLIVEVPKKKLEGIRKIFKKKGIKVKEIRAMK